MIHLWVLTNDYARRVWNLCIYSHRFRVWRLICVNKFVEPIWLFAFWSILFSSYIFVVIMNILISNDTFVNVDLTNNSMILCNCWQTNTNVWMYKDKYAPPYDELFKLQMITRDNRTILRDIFHAIDFKIKNSTNFFPNCRLQNFVCYLACIVHWCGTIEMNCEQFKVFDWIGTFFRQKKNYH